MREQKTVWSLNANITRIDSRKRSRRQGEKMGKNVLDRLPDIMESGHLMTTATLGAFAAVYA